MADIEENKSYSVSEDGKTFKSFGNRDAKEFTVPEGVTHIGEWSFATCASLVSITLPDSLTSIGDRAFLGCSSLKSIVLPAGVTEVCDGAFDYCASLEKIEVDRNNSKYCSLDGVLYTKDFRTLLCYPAGKKDEHFHVPESVTQPGLVPSARPG
ncbi:MAG: leucine-rich repeat domain-containing protein [Thermoguttaceae bacterium]|nr:leucine-rich repeat domain-containing protein [Thermoguttaceae bacterium]